MLVLNKTDAVPAHVLPSMQVRRCVSPLYMHGGAHVQMRAPLSCAQSAVALSVAGDGKVGTFTTVGSVSYTTMDPQIIDTALRLRL